MFQQSLTVAHSADAHPFVYMMRDIVEAGHFDPDGSYVRKWLPALARLPVKYIHKSLPRPSPALKTHTILQSLFARPLA